MMRKIENDLLKEGKFAYRKNGCLVLENEGVKITALYKEVDYAHIIVECANSNWQDHLEDIEDILDRIERHSLGRLLTEIYEEAKDKQEITLEEIMDDLKSKLSVIVQKEN